MKTCTADLPRGSVFGTDEHTSHNVVFAVPTTTADAARKQAAWASEKDARTRERQRACAVRDATSLPTRGSVETHSNGG